MAALVLNLCDEHRFTTQGGRASNPVAFGQHSHDLGVGVLRDLPDQGLAIGIGHPVLGLDLLVRIHLGLEARLERRQYRRRRCAHNPSLTNRAPVCT